MISPDIGAAYALSLPLGPRPTGRPSCHVTCFTSQMEDSPAAHAHALRTIEKMRQFIPDGDKSTWKIRIISASGQSVLTVISRGVEELPQRPFGRRVVNDSQKPSL